MAPLLLLPSLVNPGLFLLPLLSNSDLFLSFPLPIFLLLKPLPKAPLNLLTPVLCSKLFNLDPCSDCGTSSTSTSISTINRCLLIPFMRSTINKPPCAMLRREAFWIYRNFSFCLYAGFEGVPFPCNGYCSSVCCWDCSCISYVGS